MSSKIPHGPRWQIDFIAANTEVAERHFKTQVEERAKKLWPEIREYAAAVRVWIAKQPRDRDLDVHVQFSGYVNGIGAEIKASVRLVERRRVIEK